MKLREERYSTDTKGDKHTCVRRKKGFLTSVTGSLKRHVLILNTVVSPSMGHQTWHPIPNYFLHRFLNQWLKLGIAFDRQFSVVD